VTSSVQSQHGIVISAIGFLVLSGYGLTDAAFVTSHTPALRPYQSRSGDAPRGKSPVVHSDLDCVHTTTLRWYTLFNSILTGTNYFGIWVALGLVDKNPSVEWAQGIDSIFRHGFRKPGRGAPWSRGVRSWMSAETRKSASAGGFEGAIRRSPHHAPPARLQGCGCAARFCSTARQPGPHVSEQPSRRYPICRDLSFSRKWFSLRGRARTSSSDGLSRFLSAITTGGQ